jgi:hypothetical protein
MLFLQPGSLRESRLEQGIALGSARWGQGAQESRDIPLPQAFREQRLHRWEKKIEATYDAVK